LNGEVCSTAFAVLRPRSGINSDYLYWLTRCPEFMSLAQTRQKGNSPPAIQEADLKALEVPIAPAAEQVRIVAAVNDLFEEIEAGEAALARARESLTHFRASLLHAACTGALTADWRATNATNETGQALLQDVLAAREANRTTRNRPILEPDPAGLISLPQGWCWASVDQLTTFLGNGLARAPEGESTDRRILRISAVRPLKVNFAEHRFYRPLPGENLSGATTQRNDLLFTRYSGSEQYVGVCGLVRFDEPTLFPDKVMCARPMPNFPELAEYLQIALNAGPSRAYIAKNIRTTAGQKGIAGSSIRACPVPLPPRNEVIEIARAYHDANTGIAALPTDDFTLSLRQSILHAAFTGRLVPQDPSDEPAEALLARLRASPTPASASRRRGGATQPDLIETKA
jgi:type I restriction enzyme S subunit